MQCGVHPVVPGNACLTHRLTQGLRACSFVTRSSPLSPRRCHNASTRYLASHYLSRLVTSCSHPADTLSRLRPPRHAQANRTFSAGAAQRTAGKTWPTFPQSSPPSWRWTQAFSSKVPRKPAGRPPDTNQGSMVGHSVCQTPLCAVVLARLSKNWTLLVKVPKRSN